jgi:hypothetical protein
MKSLDWCAVTDVSKELATSIIKVVQKECHTTEDLNHYRYLYKKNILYNVSPPPKKNKCAIDVGV